MKINERCIWFLKIYRLKKKQTEAITSILSGSDVLVVLPTSFGNFMIYQALPWLSWTENVSNSPCIISACCHNEESSRTVLMKKKGINAAFIDEEQQDQQVISTVHAGHIPLFYGSPEAILSASWRSRSMLDNTCFDCCCTRLLMRPICQNLHTCISLHIL